MTAKEKAQELVSKFNFEHTGDSYILHQTVDESKRCALIAVDEILKYLEADGFPPEIEYWQEVKQEINQL